MKKIALHWQIVIALILGFGWAFLASSASLNDITLDWIDPFGEIFLRLLKLVAVPLVAVSVLKGVASLTDIRVLGKLGVRTLLLYLSTTVLAVGLGLVLVNTIQPGVHISDELRLRNRAEYEAWTDRTKGVDILDDKRLTEEASGQPPTDPALMKRMQQAQKSTEGGPLQPLVEVIPENVFGAFTDAAMLQIIAFSILFGLSMVLVGSERTQVLMKVFDGIDDVLLKMVDLIMKAAPFFVFCLVAGKVGGLVGDDPSRLYAVFESLGLYSLTLTIGLALMVFVVYPLLMRVFRRDMTLKKFFRGMSPAQLLAFSSSSSAATLPVTMECVHENLGVSKRTTGFVLPIGATINMDGTSMYQAIAVVFLAQFHMLDLTLFQQLTIVVTATLASIGAAAVPSAGLVTMILVMQSVGLNPAWISFIVPVDRLLDMGRTVVNVTGDAVVSTIVDKWS
jgi:Na+/H+-dicarboxylate symporter